MPTSHPAPRRAAEVGPNHGYFAPNTPQPPLTLAGASLFRVTFAMEFDGPGMIGTVPEAAAANKRLEVRGIEGGFVTDLRCFCGPKVADRIASKWRYHRDKVRGCGERHAGGRAKRPTSLRSYNHDA